VPLHEARTTSRSRPASAAGSSARAPRGVSRVCSIASAPTALHHTLVNNNKLRGDTLTPVPRDSLTGLKKKAQSPPVHRHRDPQRAKPDRRSSSATRTHAYGWAARLLDTRLGTRAGNVLRAGDPPGARGHDLWLAPRPQFRAFREARGSVGDERTTVRPFELTARRSSAACPDSRRRRRDSR